jgi:hypothetical protein
MVPQTPPVSRAAVGLRDHVEDAPFERAVADLGHGEGAVVLRGLEVRRREGVEVEAVRRFELGAGEQLGRDARAEVPALRVAETVAARQQDAQPVAIEKLLLAHRREFGQADKAAFVRGLYTKLQSRAIE